ncbi:MAG: thiamine pyrophosphate-dependent dehydrogenase E1 component subunit alpha [Chloroflexota bacterium]|nr:thiamine pyrophosphate-dependent dehydrogenase E1 component subunit alpha [Chloroflexota bacterium]
MHHQGMPVDVVIDIYTRVLRIRRFEEEVGRLFRQGQLPGFVHLYIGEEAVAAGVCAALTDEDTIVSTHRGHGHVIAKGGDFKRMMAELFGKAGGYCKGKGGSMHIADFDIGMLGAIGIVGGGMPIAVGAGLSAWYTDSDRVSVCFFGDGAANEGSFHESLNLASTLTLPVIFVCENNQYGEFTPARQAMNISDIADRAVGYGIPGLVADGVDALEIYRVALAAVERARAGGGPTLIEAKTHRRGSHAEGEEAFLGGQTYRDETELAAAQAKDPLLLLHSYVSENEILPAELLEALDGEITASVQEAVAAARESPEPEIAALYEDLWA